ncbi:hypothetical protein DFH07DRAFT_1010922 [Mycena maculata]|uniref:Uncharacterized protein n=1 Tax=Mycena maculata TaxID=230809 RepID=A0AAD7P011_9AGAR|nr:hypothetical protein DFH07DRAFT_1010922 [Mycena maculata]
MRTKTCKHSLADQEYIDSVSTRVVMDFRSSIYQEAYITANAHVFLDHDWIDIDALRRFVQRARDPLPSDLSTPSSLSSPAPVKIEDDASTTCLSTAPTSTSVKTRALKEGDREVLEILSDSDSDSDEFPAAIGTDFADSSSLPASSDPGPIETDSDDGHTSSDEFDVGSGLQKSDTIWQDAQISSQVRIGPIRITKEVTVQRLEYLSEIPSIYPIPKIPTGFVLDLNDPKFEIKDKKSGILHTVDALIKNKDNDRWRGNTGVGDTKVLVTFEPGQPPILCRRSRLKCKGAFVCERVDPRLLKVEHRDLDPASRDAVFAAQRQTRREEGTTAERRAAELIQVIRDQRCCAQDSRGLKCTGVPILKQKKETSRGGNFWVACSGWRKDFKENHRTWSMPFDVDENIFIKTFSGQALAPDESKDTPPCSAIVHPTTGLRQQHCAHTHIVQGHLVTSFIVNRPCDASRTIYVPLDPTIRKALIIHGGDPHSHPMPALTKVSFELKESYRKCIKSVGTVGATVTKVDNAPSTQLHFNGKSPGEFAPALQSNQAKRKLVREVKQEEYPAGLGPAGAFQLFWNDMQKPIDERYIHRLISMPDGGTMILTCLAALMRLLDDTGVTSFETDTTFRRVAGDFNEWEVVIFLKALQRAVTIARAYVNGASAKFFERLFDEFRSLKVELTGKPLAFKRFVKGGNLLAMNSDMEAVQVLGAARSIMKTNDSEYSNIADDTPAEEVASEFIKLCLTHGKRAVLDFKSLVSEQDFNRLMDFVYIDSAEKLQEFSEFVRSLGVKKIQDWWDHKEMSPWILPCMIKSQSRMSAEDWDNTPATTNTGEAQHHWTNLQTGVKQLLVEAMESGRKLDERVAREIKTSIESGVLINPHNESFHRRGRNATRQATTIRKARESRELGDERAGLALEIEAEKQARKESAATTKSGGSRTVVVSSSSSGRVKTKTIAAPEPVISQPVTSASANLLASTPSPALDLTSTMSLAFPSTGPLGFPVAADAQLPTVDWQMPAFSAAPDSHLNSQVFDYHSTLDPVASASQIGNFDASDVDLWRWLDQFNATPSDDSSSTGPQFYPPFETNYMEADPGFNSAPSSPPNSFPRLPPIPASSPPPPTATPFPAPVHNPVAVPTVSKKRKTRDEVDPRNIIHSSRARKIPRRADEN